MVCPHASHGVPSSSMKTVGSMSSQPTGPGVMLSHTSGLPMASLNGPSGLSETATPMARPLYRSLPQSVVHDEPLARRSLVVRGVEIDGVAVHERGRVGGENVGEDRVPGEERRGRERHAGEESGL